ncbi:MAG TPA: amidohydrolase family protein [Bryobacteraceae bacterium]|nr:amidohydrolase family protein [Bryobacteraceae bacterium]
MSDLDGGPESKKTLMARLTGSAAVIQIDYDDRALNAVDELIRPPDTSEFVAPGFVDVQVNGFGGVDYNDFRATGEQIAGSIRNMFSTGVTRFFATIITASEDHIVSCLRNLTNAKEEFARNQMPEAQAMEAFHVEGPHISPEDGPRGAHPRDHVRPPDFGEFQRWQDAAGGNIRLVTVSPEWDQTPAYVSQLVRSGVVASIGHTKANSDQLRAAVAAGATMSTHLGNAAHPTLPKTQNYIWEQLAEDRLSPSFIVDGIHIPEVFFRSAVRAKGAERSVLVTDAVMPAMCRPGPYRLGQVDVELREDGSVVMRGTTRLAGSALRMDYAVGNAVRMGQLQLRDAITMATTNPARVARIAGRQRGLAPGEKADLVKFRWDDTSYRLTVVETVVSGTAVYSI